MSSWSAIVLATGTPGQDDMVSRLPTYLHPVAGRPLVWHSVAALAGLQPAPARVRIVASAELPPEVFQDLPLSVEVVSGTAPDLEALGRDLSAELPDAALVTDAVAVTSSTSLQALIAAPVGAWISPAETGAAAARVDADHLAELFRLPAPLAAPHGALSAHHRIEDPAAVAVRGRDHLAHLSSLVRDRLVQNLMRGGATFLLPTTVLVDVDVRVGRDSIIYPGVVLEGQTHIGEETVVGPDCRIIDSWIGSGVELKGWNYISHTSVRNRAILEPYVRRGFD